MSMYKYNSAANAGYEPTYWCEKGKYSPEFDMLHAALVPPSGKCSYELPEVLRCIANFYYDRFNNGHCNNRRPEATFVNKFLKKRKYDGATVKYAMLDRELDAVVDFIMEIMVKEYKEVIESRRPEYEKCKAQVQAEIERMKAEQKTIDNGAGI